MSSGTTVEQGFEWEGIETKHIVLFCAKFKRDAETNFGYYLLQIGIEYVCMDGLISQ